MAALTDTTIASTYKQLLKITSEGVGADASAKYVEDGLGTDTALSLSTTRVGIGTTSPDAKLDISGDTSTWAGMAKIYLTDVNSNSSSRNWSIGNGGTAYGALSFIVSNAEDGVPADSTGTAVMSMDGVNKRVGIGTASPARTLDVVGDIQASSLIKSSVSSNSTNLATANGGTLILENSHDTDGNFSNIGGYNTNGLVASQINFVNVSQSSRHGAITLNTHNGTSLTERVRVDKDGAVGIGTDSPSNMLHVAEDKANEFAAFIKNDNADGSGLRVRADDSSDDEYILYCENGTTARFIIKAGGNVGINETSPNAKLDVDGDIQIEGANALLLNHTTGAASDTYINSPSSNVMAFRTGGTERMRITSGGDIELATDETHIHMNTSDGSDNKSWSICGGGGDSTTRGAIVHLAGNEDGEDGKLRLYAGNASNNNGMIHFHTGNSVERGKFDYTGDFYTNDGTVSSLASDVRVKDSITDLSDGLSIINQLRPVTFRYTDDSEFHEADDLLVKRYGFIADEVKEVAPQYTQEGKGKVGEEEVDDFKTLSMLKMFPMLVKAVQELSAKVEALETELQDTKDYVDHKQDYNSMAGRINSCEARIGHLEKK